MPKTRRGGKKHRARRLARIFSNLESVNTVVSQYYGIEPHYIDPEYESLFRPRDRDTNRNNNNSITTRLTKPRVTSHSVVLHRVILITNGSNEATWATRLVPISCNLRYPLCQDIPEGDPRRTHYDRLAQEIKVQRWIESNQEPLGK
ncbi:hypothetical protein DMN91_007442 [Ooceraea biroi]|uniref:Uncharacterized protein n=1 Tax=Ooceraea biroi TaxID=2015173 RepID=A0A3L8DLX7_OOCBI|nr:hypothetical protein DMN91_007442 [Ooceraea biroi]